MTNFLHVEVMSNFSEDCDKLSPRLLMHETVEVMSNFSEDCDCNIYVPTNLVQVEVMSNFSEDCDLSNKRFPSRKEL